MSYRKRSILKKMLIPLLLVMSLQAGLIYGAILFGGTAAQIQNNAFDIFGEKVSNRKNILENEMVQRWSNLEESAQTILTATDNVLARDSAEISDLSFQSELSGKLLAATSRDLLYLLRKNAVTGAYFILDNNGSEQKDGIFFRDSDPRSTPGDYSDLLAERAPSSVTKTLGIAMGSFWQPYFNFEGKTDAECAFYNKPMLAARQYSGTGASGPDLAYWSTPLTLSGGGKTDATQVITYTMPLLWKDGTPYGVLGVELAVDYLNEVIPAQELSDGSQSGYLLAVGSRAQRGLTNQEYMVAAKSGAFAKALLGGDTQVAVAMEENRSGFLTIVGISNPSNKIYGSIQPISLYNSHAPFEDEQWVLIGITAENVLLRKYYDFIQLVMLTWVLSTLMGVAGICMAARRITSPIGTLSQKLRRKKPDTAISLERIDIAEIDELLDSIEDLSKQVVDSASRLSKILELAGVAIGAYEYNAAKSNHVFCTADLFVLLDFPPEQWNTSNLTLAVLEQRLKNLEQGLEEESEDGSMSIYRIESGAEPRWIRLKRVVSDGDVLGVITDVTQDILERHKLEYERDYDLLTKLYNRRAFHLNMEMLFRHPQHLKIAALMIMDLDNLKFVNDTYGHDYGDEYIRAAADVLKKYAGSHAVVARLSGDEFVAFLHGYDSDEGIRRFSAAVQQDMWDKKIYLPDHTAMPVRASAGMAWYPRDAESCEELMRYADFAMYIVKRTQKGEFGDFNRQTYNEESYLLNCREELNTIIEKELVSYHFQPIINAHTGEIFAFEALLRPQAENIKTPLELLSLARSQSKLAQIERLTFFCALKSFSEQPMAATDCKLFINSIANQMMSEEDVTKLEQRYGSYLGRLVIELTEAERPEENYTKRKQGYLRMWNAELALDDFGVGHNGETALIDLLPQYIKLDISLVKNVHQDTDRQQILNSLINYSKQRKIKVIAEGVECREEMELLIHAGVDYLQGYYLAKPSPTPALVLEARRAEILEINSAAKA